MTKSPKLPFLDDFLLYLNSTNYSKQTQTNYERDLATFEKFLQESNTNFENISKQIIDHYKAKLLSVERKTLAEDRKTEPLSPKSINRMLTSLRSYLNYLIEIEKPTPIMPQHVKLLKLEKKVMVLPDMKEIIEFIESPLKFEKNQFVAIRNHTILEIIFASGMRISEALSLKMHQIDVTQKLYITGKGRKQRFVYLTERAIRALHQYLEIRDEHIKSTLSPTLYKVYGEKFEYVFLTKKNFDTFAKLSQDTQDNEQDIKNKIEELLTAHLSDNYLQGKLKEYRIMLGFSSPISAHTLRHGFATYLAESGANPAALQILLGHESLETTTKYVHASDKYAQKTHHDFHPLKD
jgi:integrase/recombinase XerC